MLCVVNAVCHKLALYAECRYDECHYVECRGAGESCRVMPINQM